jgi:hypothetical protein
VRCSVVVVFFLPIIIPPQQRLFWVVLGCLLGCGNWQYSIIFSRRNTEGNGETTEYYNRHNSLTSCSPVVRALVYQPSGPGFHSWHVLFKASYYKGKTQMMLLQLHAYNRHHKSFGQVKVRIVITVTLGLSGARFTFPVGCYTGYATFFSSIGLLYSFFTTFIHLLYSFYTAFIHLLYIFYTSFIQLLYIFYTSFIHLLYKFYTAFIQLLYRFYTAFIQLFCSFYTAFIQLLCSFYTAFIQLLYSFYAAFMQLLYGFYTAFMQLLYRFYTAFIQFIHLELQTQTLSILHCIYNER